jgi:hypothetical protein
MNGNGHESSSFDLGHCTSSQSILCILSNINVASQLRSTTFVHNVRGNFGITNDCGVLLAGTDACAVSRDGGVDLKNG